MKKIILAMVIVLTISGCITDSERSVYKVTIKTQKGGRYYVEVVTRASFADMQLPNTGTRTVEVEEGTYPLIWGYSNINSLGMNLDERSVYKELYITEDTTIIISGGSYTAE